MPYPPFTKECWYFGDIQHAEQLTVFCRECRRLGRYSVAGLIERYGADGWIEGWKDRLGQTCPLWALGPDWVGKRPAGRPCVITIDELIRQFQGMGPRSLEQEPL